MTAIIGQISNPSIKITPSPLLKQYLRKCAGIPTVTSEGPDFKLNVDIHQFVVSEEDRDFIKKFNSNSENGDYESFTVENTEIDDKEKLSLQDISSLYEYILKENSIQDEKVYLHELLEGSHILLPQNKLIPRSKELQQRCEVLKYKENNMIYYKMTKNVGNVRKSYPDDSFKYQLEQMNKILITIFQFIISLAAGFFFGFTGIELITSSLDLGTRLILGIICASTVALAELYFLAKKLNDDMQFQFIVH